MWLFLAVLKSDPAAEKMISAMLELELTDAAVVDGEAVENLAARTFDLFSEVGRMFSERLRYNRVLICKMPDRSTAADLVRLCREDNLDMNDPDTGFYVMIPCESWPEATR